ncbi:hypothetical protein [Roseibacillus ishigakijimensis]|uniref:FG-GAP repeat-containing protein n=1 Tax=Roseibacillus ishigakijimensis TaxID=454146 RepID=A0A934VI07_9BACT|nr:hypothetical protein [Roseibacillus ishigakijimensis]MBK1834558.1 hypothetical protein [Roseibacillus ishigakijimensis]
MKTPRLFLLIATLGVALFLSIPSRPFQPPAPKPAEADLTHSEEVPPLLRSQKSPQATPEAAPTDLFAPSSPSSPDSALLADQSLNEVLQKARLRIREVPDEAEGFRYETWNPGNQLGARFGPGEVALDLAHPLRPGATRQGSLRLQKLAGKHLGSRPDPILREGDQEQVEFHHPDGLVEWYRNRPEGLEQGFTLSHRPQSAGDEVTLEIALEGLHASEGDGNQLLLQNKSTPAFTYSKLLVFDSRGRELPARMTATSAGHIHLAFHDAGASYPVTVDPLITNSRGTVTGQTTRTAANERFGNALALSNDTLVVGAEWRNDNRGAAFVFVRDEAGYWEWQAELSSDDLVPFSAFGHSVAISGDTILVGAYEDSAIRPDATGRAYVFVRNGENWQRQAVLTSPNSEIDGFFGNAVALSGNSAFVGAPGEAVAGVYHFTRSGTTWTMSQRIVPSDSTSGDFGTSLALESSTLVVGDDSSANGSAYVFTRSGSSWNQQAKLVPSDPEPSARFGFSVALSGTTIAVGAPNRSNDSPTPDGAVYLYNKSGASWNQTSKLAPDLPEEVDLQFGESLSLLGDRLAIGDRYGTVWFSQRTAGAWSLPIPLGLEIRPESGLGRSVLLEPDHLLSGAPLEGEGQGLVIQFSFPDGFLNTPNVSAVFNYPTQLGLSVALSGQDALIGAPGDNFARGIGYLFHQATDGSWVESGTLRLPAAAEPIFFGFSVALENGTAVLTSRNLFEPSIIPFLREDGQWQAAESLSAQEWEGGANFGRQLALSGNRFLTTTSDNRALVFARQGQQWHLEATLQPDAASASYEDFTYADSIALEGEIAAIGSPQGGSENKGGVLIFSRASGTWTQQTVLTASDGTRFDGFGAALSLQGNQLLVGAPREESDPTSSSLSEGAAYLFRHDGESWTEERKIVAAPRENRAFFGSAVSLSHQSALIGSFNSDQTSRLHLLNPNDNWQNEGTLFSGTIQSLNFSLQMAHAGNRVLLGEASEFEPEYWAGAVYFFEVLTDGLRQLSLQDASGLGLSPGASYPLLPGTPMGEIRDLTFHITNTGTEALDLYTITLGGPQTSQFALTAPSLAASPDLASGQSLSFQLHMSPVGETSGPREVTLIISSNDSAHPTTAVTLTGLAYSPTADADGDGLADWPEYLARSLGFDWEEAQPSLVADLQELDRSRGLVSAEDLGGLAGDFSLVTVDPASNRATLRLALWESPDLTTFSPLPVSAGEVSTTPSGEVEIEVTLPSGKSFYRAEFTE